MVKLNVKTLGKFGLIAALGLGTLSLGACSTTSGATAQAAPITYKIDQGKFQQAALIQPYTGLTHQPRTYTAPQPLSPRTERAPAMPVQKPVQKPRTLPSLPVIPQFDSASVDTVLYKHQRVGKTYSIMGKSYTPKHQPRYDKTGTASWYGDKFHGKPTATGELYDMNDLTAAHKTLPLNSMVYVTNMETGKGMLVRINDRGPFVDDRIIDLSRATARRLGLFTSGLANVRVQYAGPADPMSVKTKKRPVARPAVPQITAPKQTIEPNPELVVEAPQTNLHKYKPLRDLGRAPAAQTTVPPRSEPQLPFQPKHYVNPLLGHGDTSAAPTAPNPTPLPQTALVPKKGDGPITLTIKGPIHMATSRDTDARSKAKFIPAVNYKNIPTTGE